MRLRNILLGRDGTAISGDPLDKTFTIVGTLGKTVVKASAIAWIHFKGTPATPKDEIWLHGGDRLSGVISGRSLRWRDASGARRTIPYKAIHSVVLAARA